MALPLNAQGLVDTKERFHKNCGLEIFSRTLWNSLGN